MLAVAMPLMLVPLYGILFPPTVDLIEHVFISKLLWEKLAGVSHLDLEISWFLGYRLIPIIAVSLISLFKWIGVSLVYLPKTILWSLAAFHTAVVVAIVYMSVRRGRSHGTYLYPLAFAVPAAVIMYSACWFIGFVNYTLGITLLLPSIFLTELFLRDRKSGIALLLGLNLALVYMAHPFVPVFWVVWCAGRGMASILTWRIRAEWKGLFLLPAIVAPVAAYHFIATRLIELTPSAPDAAAEAPSMFVPVDYWLQYRIWPLIDGTFLRADELSSTGFFGAATAGLVLCALLFALIWGGRRAKAMMLSCLLLAIGASWVNEQYLPTPSGHWLALDYRFYSTVAAICVTVAAVVLARIAASSRQVYRHAMFGVVAAVGVVASATHLISVRAAYTRFDGPARQYVTRIFNAEPTGGIELPASQWHPDGSFLSSYRCLKEDDCNPAGTTFDLIGGPLYPVRVRRPGADVAPLANSLKPDPGPAVPPVAVSEN